MNAQTKEAATRNVIKNSPPRLNSNRCGNDHIAAAGLNQPKGDNVNKIAQLNSNHEVATSNYFSAEQIEILKNCICKGASDEEFNVFIMACQKTQLDPFMKQIYCVKRYDSRLKRETMTIQTGIDGYRLIAERTERYAPGPKPSYEYDANGNLVSATAYVKKLTRDGTWHVVEAEAFLDEYCQTFTDKQTGEKRAMGMWNNMQRNQLSKCAESLALRKAFPAEMSGVYTKDEMKQAETYEPTVSKKEIAQKISSEQAADLEMILSECDMEYRQWVFNSLKKQYNIMRLADAPVEIFERMKTAATKNMEQNHARQRSENAETIELVEV